VTLAAAIEQTCAALETTPDAGRMTFATDNILVGVTEVDVRIRDHELTIDEPPSLGGADAGANPVELVLAGLGGCQAIALRVWATKLGIPFDSVRVVVEGDLDVRGFFGVDDEVRPGYGGVRVTAYVSGPETPERYAELYEAVEAHCPVQDIIANPVPVATELRVLS
jgi:uncharacterized OsmC-like protein